MKKYKLIIIGFGVSGICCSSIAKQHNLDFCVLEQNNTFGGIWNFSLKTSRLQTHKTYYEFPDYKMDYNCDNYPDKQTMLSYFNKYINHHKLEKNVFYNTKVLNIVYNHKNKIWIIATTNNGIYNEYNSEYICISSGYNFHPNIPNNLKQLFFTESKIISNIKTYHSKELYKIDLSKEFTNKNVVIIGNGASACDILGVISKYTNDLYVLYNSNKYYINKTICGVSLSIILNKMVLYFFKNLNVKIYVLLFTIFNALFFNNYLDLPNSRVNSKNLIASTIISKLINDKKLFYIKDSFKHTIDNNVILENSVLFNIDIIILATGYKSITNFKFEYNINCDKYYNIILPENIYCGIIGFSPSYNWLITSYKQSQFFIEHITKNDTQNTQNTQNSKYISRNTIDINKHIEKYKKEKDKMNINYNDLTYELFDFL